MNRLKGMRAYLGGAMDRVPDGGVGWRRSVGQWLRNRGVITLDPSDKPIDIGIEEIEDRKVRHARVAAGDFEPVVAEMKKIRCVDLRMVDLSDFLVINLDLEVHACGTYEELFLANRQKKPIILRIEQGKRKCPDWLFGTLPHEHMFDCWHHVHEYLRRINGDAGVTHDKRWMFFDYSIPGFAK